MLFWNIKHDYLTNFPKISKELQTIQTFWSSVSDDLIYAIWLICYRLSSKNDIHETLRRISLITFPRHKDQEGWSYQMTKTIFEISHGVIYQYQTLKTLSWMTIPDFQWHKGCPNNNIPETPRGMNVRNFVCF